MHFSITYNYAEYATCCSKHLKGLIDDKVGEDIIKQELAKKADVMALGAYTKKVDADALVYNAMGEHAKQVEVISICCESCMLESGGTTQD